VTDALLGGSLDHPDPVEFVADALGVDIAGVALVFIRRRLGK
jgi:hypothetical protein